MCRSLVNIFFFFNDTATTEIYTLSLHDALPILYAPELAERFPLLRQPGGKSRRVALVVITANRGLCGAFNANLIRDRKSTRLNSSHSQISYAVFCLKKKNKVRIKL